MFVAIGMIHVSPWFVKGRKAPKPNISVTFCAECSPVGQRNFSGRGRDLRLSEECVLSFAEYFLSKNDKKLLTSVMGRGMIPTVKAHDTFSRGWPPGGNQPREIKRTETDRNQTNGNHQYPTDRIKKPFHRTERTPSGSRQANPSAPVIRIPNQTVHIPPEPPGRNLRPSRSPPQRFIPFPQPPKKTSHSPAPAGCTIWRK